MKQAQRFIIMRLNPTLVKFSLILRIPSIPDMPGNPISINTTCGRSFRIPGIAVSQSQYVLMQVNSAVPLINIAKLSRISLSSSTIETSITSLSFTFFKIMKLCVVCKWGVVLTTPYYIV